MVTILPNLGICRFFPIRDMNILLQNNGATLGRDAFFQAGDPPDLQQPGHRHGPVALPEFHRRIPAGGRDLPEHLRACPRRAEIRGAGQRRRRGKAGPMHPAAGGAHRFHRERGAAQGLPDHQPAGNGPRGAAHGPGIRPPGVVVHRPQAPDRGAPFRGHGRVRKGGRPVYGSPCPADCLSSGSPLPSPCPMPSGTRRWCGSRSS